MLRDTRGAEFAAGPSPGGVHPQAIPRGVTPPIICDSVPSEVLTMWNWLAGFLHKLDRWLHRGRLPATRQRSNLHARHR
jgi:hypothetical protein